MVAFIESYLKSHYPTLKYSVKLVSIIGKDRIAVTFSNNDKREFEFSLKPVSK